MIDNIESILMEDSANSSIREYTSYVLTSRVLPRVDGLKPVQRRVLYSMILMGCRKKFRKSAIIIGETMKYHSHGDSSIYTALANLVNSPNNLVEGQGNWGSEESANVAAPRYTEAKTSDIFEELFDESCMEKKIGDFVLNFSEDEYEPYTMQFKVPLARLIGVNGIGIGFATATPALSFECLKSNLYKVIEDKNHLISDVEYAYGGSEYKNTIYPSFNIVKRDGKNYIHITDIPKGSTKVVMNSSDYLRELMVSDQLEIIDESDVTNYRQPISIYISGPSTALKMIIDSMKKKVPDYLYYYHGRLRSTDYELSWLDSRRKYIAKRTYFEKERVLIEDYQKKALSTISEIVEKSEKRQNFQELAGRVGKDTYKEYENCFKCEDAKQFMRTEEEFISSLNRKPISAVKKYDNLRTEEIRDMSNESLNEMIIAEIDKIDKKLFSKPTKKMTRFPNIDKTFSMEISRYVTLRNGSFAEVSFKRIPRMVNFETKGDIYLVYDDCSTELVNEKFFGTASNSEKNLAGFMFPDLPTVVVTITNKIICYKRLSKIDELIKSAFPACNMIIDGKEYKMTSGSIFENVKEYKILSQIS